MEKAGVLEAVEKGEPAIHPDNSSGSGSFEKKEAQHLERRTSLA